MIMALRTIWLVVLVFVLVVVFGANLLGVMQGVGTLFSG